MNDRLKFRVFDIARNEYCDLTREDVLFFIGTNGKLCRCLLYDGGYTALTYPTNEFFKVEFCTELKDKNSKLIYEGDMFKPDYDNEEESCIVIWDDETASFKVRCDGHFEQWNGLYETTVEWSENIELADYLGEEIIGNIHENPELLEIK
ncbi:MAG: YopX family protein [bacterium]